MEIEFFLEILGRLSNAVNLSDEAEISPPKLLRKKVISTRHHLHKRKKQFYEQQPITPDVTSRGRGYAFEKESNSIEETPTTEQQQSNPIAPQPVEETSKPDAEPVQEVPTEQSDVTEKNTDESSSTPKNIVDQFRNNSPSIADRAQNKTDDSTSHLLKRGASSSEQLNRPQPCRFLIINDVFGGKRINFDKEIECIDKLSDLDSAMNYLNDNVVKMYNVNTSTKGFEILNKVVARRFAS